MKSLKNTSILFLLLINMSQAQSYQHISTSELEQKVELHSINGTLPFEMGLELIKRWTKD